MRSHRKLLALAGIAIIALALFAPAGAACPFVAILAPVWLEFQPHIVVVVPPEPASPPEQPVSLRALAPFRAPPAVPSV